MERNNHDIFVEDVEPREPATETSEDNGPSLTDEVLDIALLDRPATPSEAKPVAAPTQPVTSAPLPPVEGAVIRSSIAP